MSLKNKKETKRKEIDTTHTNHNCNLVVGNHITITMCFFSPVFLMTFIFMFPRIQSIGWMCQDFEVLCGVVATLCWSA
jgi:hypothetical protein